LSTWAKALTAVQPKRLIYGSDVFWPTDPEAYLQSYLLPQLGLFETAATNEHVAEEGSDERKELRKSIFYDNAWDHWCQAVREPQSPRRSPSAVHTPGATSSPR